MKQSVLIFILLSIFFLSTNSIAGTLDCSTAIHVRCGDVITGSTATLPNTAYDYSCSGVLDDGGEQVFILDLPAPAIVTATITDGPFFNIYLLYICDENTCLSWDTDQIICSLLPGTHYFVLDSDDLLSGSYEVQFECVLPIPTATNETFLLLFVLLGILMLRRIVR